MVWPPFTGPHRTRWRRIAASATFFGVVLAGAALTIDAALRGASLLSGVPGEFWVLVALAVAADFRPFTLPVPARRTTTFLVSPCFCFAILLLYPPSKAIVVQVVAAAVAAPRLHVRWPAWAFLTARLVCSLAVASWVADVLGLTTADIRDHPSVHADLQAVIVALAFLAVTVLISVAGALLSRATRAEIMAQLRIEVLARSSVLLIGVVIVSVPTAWSRALLVVPLLGWYELSRHLEDRERRLEHDQVTWLLSRHGLIAAVAALPRSGTPDADGCALIVVELRRIPYLHRTLSHGVVERLTGAVAARLRECAGQDDLIGELSESQFVVVRPRLAGWAARPSALRVVAALSHPVESDGVLFRLDPVAGVAVGSLDSRELDELISRAEAALVEADSRQELAWVYTEEAKSDVDDRLALLRDLGAALGDPSRESELVMLYQPQIALATGQIESVEALFRWSHPVRGTMATDSLIELVEPTGVMQELTRYVLSRVVSQLGEWNRAGIHLRAAVNVSVNDLSTRHFDAQIASLLREHGVPASQLDIEITERAVEEATRVLDESSRRVADLGVGLSLDDFGTGFASLRRLRQMPLSEVKIDRSYVGRIAYSPADLAIVKTIHDFANVLGLRLVAEGIENEETARILEGLGGVIGQGWLYARPMTAEDLVHWLRREYRAA
jgi:predicted signal transduction protein with EAL and GGDEF domain